MYTTEPAGRFRSSDHSSHATEPLVRVETSCPLCDSVQFTQLPVPRHWVGAEVFARCRGQIGLTRCHSCGFVFTNPRPSSELLARFYDGVVWPRSHAVAAGPIGPLSPDARARMDYFLDVIAQHVPVGTMLDYGCNEGAFLRCARLRGWRASGYEVGTAYERCRAFELPVVPDLAAFLPGTFDAIFLNQVLEHVEDRAALLTRLRTLLTRGGRLFAQVPNASSLRARIAAPWITRNTPLADRFRSYPIHLAYFTPETLTRTVERAGFRVESVQTFGLGRYELFPEDDAPAAKSEVAMTHHAHEPSPGGRAVEQTPGSIARAKGWAKRAFYRAGLGESVMVVAAARESVAPRW